jgi:hypothetical protein
MLNQKRKTGDSNGLLTAIATALAFAGGDAAVKIAIGEAIEDACRGGEPTIYVG